MDSPAPAEGSSSSQADDDETFLLLLLSDSNLPTGGFVASSGLESFHAHGLLHNARPNHAQTKRITAPSQAQLSSATLSFARSTLHSYARSCFPFLTRVWVAVQALLEPSEAEVDEEARVVEGERRLHECLDAIAKLDDSYHSLLLNHVARRASKAQGIALLTLYSKAFAQPINLSRQPYNPDNTSTSSHNPSTESKIYLAAKLVDRLKMDIRRSSNRAGHQVHGHLPICWAVFATCLGISLEKAVYLHLFLQARSLFSSSIRLNTLGPYLAHQVMRFQMRGIVEGIVKEMEAEGCFAVGTIVSTMLANPRAEATKQDALVKEQDMHIDQQPPPIEPYSISEPSPSLSSNSPITEAVRSSGKPFRTTSTMTSISNLRPKIQPLRIGKNQLIPVQDDNPSQGWAWDWPEEQDIFNSAERPTNGEKGFWTQRSAPATTFPLGEIVQARHDQLHSRLFNS